MGIVNGEASNGLVVVDIDVPEALKIAGRFLKETLKSGRESTPNAHRWYQAFGASTKKYQDIDGKMLLEVRSDGCQTLAPPSRHPNDERYRWDPNSASQPVEVPADELEMRCTLLATATLVARHMPPIGGRHEYTKAVLGCLMRRLGKKVALKIVQVAWQAADADSTDAIRDLEGIAKDADCRLAEGDNVFGGPKLEEMVPGLLSLLNRWWGWDVEGGVDSEGEGVPTHDELRDRWLQKQPSPIAYGQSEWRRYGAGFWSPLHDQVIFGEIDIACEEAKPEGIRPTAGMRGSIERMARAKKFVSDEIWDANEDILVPKRHTRDLKGRFAGAPPRGLRSQQRTI